LNAKARFADAGFSSQDYEIACCNATKVNEVDAAFFESKAIGACLIGKLFKGINRAKLALHTKHEYSAATIEISSK
jgi:hypothetical protein